MRPRVFLLTHYQVCRPGIFSFLVSRCSSPSQSQTAEIAATRLYKGFRNARFNKLSARAAEEAVRMAVGYEFLSEAGSWTPKGQVIGTFASRPEDAKATDFLALRQHEVLAHLKYYLQVQGHLFLQVGQFILQNGSVSEDTLKKEPLLEKWLKSAYEWSLSGTPELRDRVKLREKIKELASGRERYKPEVRWHKLAPIVWPLVDFGILETSVDQAGKRFRHFTPASAGDHGPLASLLRRLSSPEAIDEEDNKGTLLQAISYAYGIDLSESADTSVSSLLVETYLKVRMPTTRMGALAAIYDICAVRGIVDLKAWIPPAKLHAELQALQTESPGEVRFHYDRAGHKSSVIISDSLIKHF